MLLAIGQRGSCTTMSKKMLVSFVSAFLRVFTIIFIFFLWLMETALWCKTQEVKQYTWIILSLMYMSLCTHLHVFSLMPVRGPRVHVCTFTLVPPCWHLPEFPDPTSLWSGQTRKNWLTHPERHQILASGEHEAKEVNK